MDMSLDVFIATRWHWGGWSPIFPQDDNVVDLWLDAFIATRWQWD